MGVEPSHAVQGPPPYGAIQIGKNPVYLFGMNKAKNPAAVELGRRGGKARGRKLSKKELSEQARRAVNARWAKKGKDGR
jgi:hypothetical protein